MRRGGLPLLAHGQPAWRHTGVAAGQKVFTVQGAMPREAQFTQALCADVQGFSLPAATTGGALVTTAGAVSIGADTMIPCCDPGGAGTNGLLRASGTHGFTWLRPSSHAGDRLGRSRHGR